MATLFDETSEAPACFPCDTGMHERCRRDGCACGCRTPPAARRVPDAFVPVGTVLDEEPIRVDVLSVACPKCLAAKGDACVRGVAHFERRLAAQAVTP